MNAQATKIKKSIFAAIDAHAAGTIFIHSAEEGQNFISQLEENLEEVKRRMYNETLLYYALIGHALGKIKEGELVPLKMKKRGIKTSLFLAEVFPDIQTIWYLRDLSPTDISEQRTKHLNEITKEVSKKRA